MNISPSGLSEMIVLEGIGSLKSVTVFKVASESLESASAERAERSGSEAAAAADRSISHAGLPFVLALPPVGEALNQALCLVTHNLISTIQTGAETRLFDLNEIRVVNIEQRKGRDALVVHAEAVDLDDQWMYLLSTPNSCRNGVFLTKLLADAGAPNLEELCWLCGKRGRGFRDGGAGEAMFNHLKMGKSYSCSPPSSPSLRSRCNRVLAVYDQGNYAIRLIDVDESSASFGTVRTICGGGLPGYCDGSSDESLLRDVGGMMWSHNGDALIFSDTPNHALRVIRRVHQFDSLFLDKFEVLSLIAPSLNASLRFGLVDGEISTALCRFPCGLAPAPGRGCFYFADRGNNAVRMVNIAEGTVRTVVSTDDYEDGAPVPLGLVEPTQVLPLNPVGPTTPGSAFAFLVASRSQRTISMVMSSSLPVPNFKKQTSGSSSMRLEALYQPGEMYLNLLCNDEQSFSTRLRRNAHKRQAAQLVSPRSASATRRFSAMYIEIERERTRHDEDARVREHVSRSSTPRGRRDEAVPRCSTPKTPPAGIRRSASSRSPLASASLRSPNHQSPRSTPRVSSRRDLPLVHEHTTPLEIGCSALCMLYNAHALAPASAVATNTSSMQHSIASESVTVEGGNMSLIGFWQFLVLTNSIRGNAPQLIESISECYASAVVKDGYKVKSQMCFERFLVAVCRFNDVKDMSAAPAVNAAVQQVVRIYCNNASSPAWAERRLVLDLIAANEKPLRIIFDAYANTVDRGEHVGRVPFLRFQSLLHTVHLYPSLLTNYRLKALFAEAMRGSLFTVDPLLPPSSKTAAAEHKRAGDDPCRSGSMTFIHFVDAIVRVAVAAFGDSVLPANVFSDAAQGEMVVARRLEMFYEWLNVEIRTMEPSTITAERLKKGNVAASAVFPSKVPLFVVSQKGKLPNAVRPKDCLVAQPRGQMPQDGMLNGSGDELGKDLRHMRRLQDSLNTSVH